MPVVSIQRFQLTLADTVASNTASLAGGTVVDNCVPFMTVRVTTPNATGDRMGNYITAAWITDSPPTLHVERGNVDAAVVVEVEVVEFDGTSIKVQHGSFSKTSISDYVVGSGDIDAIVVADSFLYFTYYIATTTNATFEPMAVRGRITGTQELTFDQAVFIANIQAYWYIIESTEFDVQHFTITLTDTETSDSYTASPTVTAGKSFVVGSGKIDTADSDANSTNTVEIHLATDGTAVQMQRASGQTGDILTFSGSLVSFSNTGSVQRGTYTGGIESTHDLDLGSAVNRSNAIVHPAGRMGNRDSGSYPGTSSSVPPEAFCTWTWVDDNTVQVSHYAVAEASNDLSWEAIVWPTAGSPPPRRVFVIT